jgi:two-component system OmpR family sensor kinase/two-component system sensor histidine kinase BaeS
MLAFLVVILVAVGTVALLSGWITAIEFRRYAFAQGGWWEQQAVELAAFYRAHGSWDGVQDALSLPQGQGTGRQGRGRGRGDGGTGPPSPDFRLADPNGRIVGDTSGYPGSFVSQEELESGGAIRVVANGQVVGYLLPSGPDGDQASVVLDVEQAQFLSRVRTVLWIAALAATVVALIIGGLLFRPIVGPLRRLTTASQAIAEGDLSVRAPVQGQDEVAQLADAFNRMADSLGRAEEARRNQVADVAHELRTPLTVLQGALEAMLDGIYPTDRENLLAALSQVRTLGRLVEDLRLLALADAGQLHLSIAPVDLTAVVRETVEFYQARAQEREVSLKLDAPPSLPPISADRDRLTQVVGNLLENALRYVPKGGHVTVRVVDCPQEVEVAVIDDGPGVPAEDLPRLFDRFWRGDRARQRVTGGSGLGLAIARSLIEAHGGRIWAESVEGQGSTFTFTLPVSVPN